MDELESRSRGESCGMNFATGSQFGYGADSARIRSVEARRGGQLLAVALPGWLETTW